MVSSRLRDESGVSLVEVLLALMIFGVVSAGVTGAAVSTLRASAQVDAMTSDQNGARNALAVLSRDLRTAVDVRPTEAPAFVHASGDEVRFTALLGSSTRPQLVRIYVDADLRIVEDATPPSDGTYEGGDLVWKPEEDAQVRYVTSYFANQPGESLFTYFDDDGARIAPTGRALTAAELNRVASVGIRLAVSSDPSGRTGRYVVESRVRLPNVVGRGEQS